MDKTFVCMLLIGFAITALWITCFTVEAGIKGDYKNTTCKRAMYCFCGTLWLAIMVLTILTIIY